MLDRFEFDQVARVPAAGDNVAIATRRLEAGVVVADEAGEFRLSHTILEGHRFVRESIPQGAHLTSWGLPFGVAVRALHPGICDLRRQPLEPRLPPRLPPRPLGPAPDTANCPR